MLKNGQRVGNYIIEGRLGKGASGVVYVGRPIGSVSRKVSVKEYNFNHRETDRRSLINRSFDTERRVMPLLIHSNIPRFYDSFTQNEKGYNVSEYVEGESVRRSVDRDGSIPEQELLSLTGDVSEALAYLHQNADPVIHADVKPDNIIITPNGVSKLIDFGLSRFSSEGRKEKTGTVGFIAYETVTEGVISPYSDIYSLGWVFQFGHTGMHPNTSPLHWTRDADRQNLDIDLYGISGESIELVRACVAPDPFSRPRAAEIAEKIRFMSRN